MIFVQITFCPTSAKYFKEEVVFVCDNCHVKEFSLEGKKKKIRKHLTLSALNSHCDIRPKTFHSDDLALQRSFGVYYWLFLGQDSCPKS